MYFSRDLAGVLCFPNITLLLFNTPSYVYFTSKQTHVKNKFLFYTVAQEENIVY